MGTLTITAPAVLPAGQIVATGLSADDYMAQYADSFHEWAEGVVIKMSPQSLPHMLIIQYLLQWLNAYFALNPVGCTLIAPFVMRLDALGRIREPDLQVVLDTNPSELTHTALVGPADICIEVVSPESATRDYGDKLVEYEQGGVREYWIIDPLRQRCDFNRRTDAGVYAVMQPDADGHYRTPLLPGLALHVPTLWQEKLPDLAQIMASVQAMLAGD